MKPLCFEAFLLPTSSQPIMNCLEAGHRAPFQCVPSCEDRASEACSLCLLTLGDDSAELAVTRSSEGTGIPKHLNQSEKLHL